MTYGNCLADGAASIRLYYLDMLAPGVANLLGVWARFKSWLKEWRDLLVLCCILLFVCRFAGNLCTVVAAAVRQDQLRQ
ncbi:MAG: hypothetical protein GY696_40675 [Gammaproteobacteria bacterium]|nr:hypothetical protein [Gammaproteobacteria bacterium]